MSNLHLISKKKFKQVAVLVFLNEGLATMLKLILKQYSRRITGRNYGRLVTSDTGGTILILETSSDLIKHWMSEES